MNITEFSLAAYKRLLEIITDSVYDIVNYHEWETVKHPCILRHDIDFSIKAALELAKLEAKHSVKSAYFVLLKTDFYNLSSRENSGILQCILDLGHEIGLHFDEQQYSDETSLAMIVEAIQEEAYLLGRILGIPVTTVSMHRPSKRILDADVRIPNIVNSYSQLFFKQFKYLSDSRHQWKEDAENIISSGVYDRIHLLTHPIWYQNGIVGCREKLMKFVGSAGIERYDFLSDNFTGLSELITREEIAHANIDRTDS